MNALSIFLDSETARSMYTTVFTLQNKKSGITPCYWRFELVIFRACHLYNENNKTILTCYKKQRYGQEGGLISNYVCKQ